MIENFKINLSEVDKISVLNQNEKNFRVKNLEVFNKKGFPTKQQEDWKFSDVREIFTKNFSKLSINQGYSKEDSIELIKDFDHNYILLINGELVKSDFKFEDQKRFKINNYHEEYLQEEKSDNPLVCLNHALSTKGYFLEIENNYRFKKVLVIYNLFTEELSNQILNNKNKILIGENSELHTIDYTINRSKNKFFNNSYENIILNKNSKFRSISIQANKSEGFFHKFSNSRLKSNSNYSNFIFSSGLKFNKQDLKFDLEGENSDCNVRSAIFLNENDHQEIKTKINHLVPHCRSFQKIKKVLDSSSKGVYQGKIFVKDIAQKTNAYQLSKAILLSENSEFNSKPELEIYADDVKCSHGSTSGSLDENSIHYLMTRGLTNKEARKLLISGFLSDITSEIKNDIIRKFVESKLNFQINGY